MAALPYMPLFVADYLADTAHLTATQHGAYMLLLMNYWQRGGPLPDNDQRLASIARVGPREWARMREAVSEFFTVTHGAWSHSRVDAELARVADKSLKSKRAAQASVERRFGERSTPVEPTDTDNKQSIPLDKSNGDPEKQFWDNAKAYLQPHCKGSPGALVNAWMRDNGKDMTMAAINAAQLERAVDPIAYAQGYFRRHKARANDYNPDRITV